MAFLFLWLYKFSFPFFARALFLLWASFLMRFLAVTSIFCQAIFAKVLPNTPAQTANPLETSI